MSNVEFGPINVELRVKESELLDDAFYQQLLESTSFEEASRQLQGTPYEFLKDPNQIEAALTDYLAKIYKSAFELSPDTKVVEFASLKYAYHNLKVLFKSYYHGNDLSNLLIPIGKYSVEDLELAVKTGQNNVLSEKYLSTIQQVQSYIDESQKFQSIDILLDHDYLEHLFTLAQAIDGTLSEWVKEYIDLNRIVFALRLAKTNKSMTSLSGMIPDIGNLSSESMIQWSKGDLDSFNRALLDTQYGSALSGLLDDSQRVDPTKLEKYIDNYIMDKFKLAKFEAFGPFPLLAYLYAKETEVKNIRVIMTGIKNNLPKELVEKTLRENYM